MSTDEYVPEWSYDADAEAGYLRLRNGKVRGSEAVGEFGVVDFGQDDETLGIEVLLSADAALIDAWLARVRRDAAADAERAARLAHARAHNADLAREDEKRRADQAETCIQAVRDALDGYGKPTDRIGGLPDAIRRALEP